MRASALSLPLLSLSVLAACAPEGGLPGLEGEHPCKTENHCVREDGESLCEPGYQWEDPSDEDNYNCVEIPVEPGREDFKLPSGGSVDFGFYNVAGGGDAGSHNWALIDMNGDAMPDLVLFGQRASDGNNYGYGFPNDPHWRVHLSTGSGFAAESTRFKLPAGGSVDFGFYSSAGGGDAGSHNWALIDMDGDRRPDLVLFGQRASDGDNYGYGFPNDPHWRVHANTGSGFAAESTRFKLPEGGSVDFGFYSSAGGGDPGSHTWSLLDMNGDAKPDLVVTGQRASDGNNYGYGYPDNPHWRVYINDGTRFVK